MSFIEDELDKLQIYLTKDVGKAIDGAGRKSIARAGISMRKQTGLEIRKMYSKLKAGDAKKHFALIVKKQGHAEKHTATIGLNTFGLPLINFMTKGQRTAAKKQKGVKVKKRKPLKINLGSGKKIVLKTAFVRKKKTEQVFARKKKGGWRAQSTRSPEHLFHSKKHYMPVSKAGVETYNKNFRHELRFRLNKLAAKAA